MNDILGWQYFDNSPKKEIEEKIKAILSDHVSKGRVFPIFIYVNKSMIEKEIIVENIPIRPNAGVAFGHFWFIQSSTPIGDTINQSWKEDTKNGNQERENTTV